MENPAYACFFPGVDGNLIGLMLDADVQGIRPVPILVADQQQAEDYCKQAGATLVSPEFLYRICMYRHDNFSWKNQSSWRKYPQSDYLLRIYWHEADWLIQRMELVQDAITELRERLAQAPERSHEYILEIPGRTLLLRAWREENGDNVNLSALSPSWPSDIK